MGNIIDGYLNQTATWKRKTGVNSYGEPVFAEAVDIAVRWEGGLTMVRDKTGKEVRSQAAVLCTANVSVDDILTYAGQDCIVISFTDCPDLDGKNSIRWVYV